jgi:hypothetical protein
MSSRFLLSTTNALNDAAIVGIVEDSNQFVQTVNSVPPDSSGNVVVVGGGTVDSVNLVLPVAGNVSLITSDIPEAVTNYKYTTDAQQTWINAHDLTQISGTNTDNHFIAYDTTAGKFIAQDFEEVLNNVTDVNITAPADNHVLRYDTGNWVNGYQQAQYVKTPVANAPARDDLEYHLSLFHSACYASSGGLITQNVGLTSVDISSGEIFIRNGTTSTDVLYVASFPATVGLALTDASLNYIYAIWNAGAPILAAYTTTQNEQNNVLLGMVYRDGTTLYIETYRIQGGDHARAMSNKSSQSEGAYGRVSGLLLAEKAASLQFTISAGDIWLGLIERSVAAYDSAITTFDYVYFNGAAWISTPANSISNSLYNNAGTLTTMTNNRYKADYVYLSTKGGVMVVYAYSEETSLANSELTGFPSSIPPWAFNYKACGKLLLQEGGNILENQSIYVTSLQLQASLTAQEITYDPSSSTTPLISSDVKSALDELDSNMHSIPINQLSDVTESLPSASHVLVRDGAAYVNRKLTWADINQSGQIIFVNNGTAGAPALTWSSDTDSGLYFSGNPIFSVGGSPVQEWKAGEVFFNTLVRFNTINNVSPVTGQLWRDLADDKIKYYDGVSTFDLTATGGGGGALNDLSDVSNVTPADKHVLVYDGVTDNRYENRLLVKNDVSNLQNETLTLSAGAFQTATTGTVGVPAHSMTNTGIFESLPNTLSITTDFTTIAASFANAAITFNKKLILTPVANGSPSNNDIWLDSTTNRLHVYTGSKNVNLPPIISSSEADLHVMIYNGTNTQYENRLITISDLSDGARITTIESNNAFTSDVEANEDLAENATATLTYDDTTKPISFLDLSVDTFALANDITASHSYTGVLTNIQDGLPLTHIDFGEQGDTFDKTRRINIDMTNSITTNGVKFHYNNDNSATFLIVSAINLYGSNDVNDFTTTATGSPPANLINAMSTMGENVESIQSHTNAGPYRYYTVIWTSNGQFGFEKMQVVSFQVRQIAGGLSNMYDGTDFLLNRQTDGLIEYKSTKTGTNTFKINVSNAIDYVVNRDVFPTILNRKRVVSRSVSYASFKNLRVSAASPITLTKDSDGYIDDGYNICNNAAAYVYNLPEAPTDQTRVIIYALGNTTTFNITVNKTGADTINSTTSFVMNTGLNQCTQYLYDEETSDWVVTDQSAKIVLHEDDMSILAISSSFTASVTVYLPTAPRKGCELNIKDAGGNTGVQNLIVSPDSQLLDLFTTSYTMNTNFDHIRVIWTGTEYFYV